MTSVPTLSVGIVGACGRGASFRSACQLLGIRIAAVCDIYAEGLPKAKETLGAEEAYLDYQQMLERAKLDAVIIGTPMPLHVPQAVMALEKNIHVLSEVPVGISIDECRQLVRACKTSKALYMMAENYTYIRSNMVIREMVRQGLFGRPYYAEGEYLHELKELNEITKWRRKWQTGINGLTYPTHSLGPILQWMPGDRVVSLCCAGSGHHYKDPRGDSYENEDSCVMLCKMRSGGLVKIRLDMLSNRPHAMTNYQLQGTDGCYESSRGGPGQSHRIWLRERCPDMHTWRPLEDFYEEFTPTVWKTYLEQAKQAGHGGGDLIEMVDFLDAVTGKREADIGIHQALDMTLPGLVSQQSIAQGGAWLDVPDSREW
ncbi:MAG: Gfo/Idh/MocA family oxidoreductase [Phycisphaeraceae bacterium]|nr:Gfo/Idh/MocA family oxidoreductase [Phycisphaeraceae bacterium]